MTVQSKQQTGRTSRMVAHAIALSRTYYRVVILTDNMKQVTQIKNDLGVAHENIWCFPVPAANAHMSFHWNTMQLKGPGLTAANSIVLIDHYAIERRLKALTLDPEFLHVPGALDRVLEMLHRYDAD
jgi:hypothetical protein